MPGKTVIISLLCSGVLVSLLSLLTWKSRCRQGWKATDSSLVGRLRHELALSGHNLTHDEATFDHNNLFTATSRNRQLSNQDWFYISQLFKNVQMGLPDMDVQYDSTFIRLRSLFCGNVDINDIQSNVAQVNGYLVYTNDLYWSNTICQGNYSWTTTTNGVITSSGSGNLTALTASNQAHFQYAPFTVISCSASMDVTQIKLFGAINPTILDYFQTSMIGFFEQNANSAVCTQIGLLNLGTAPSFADRVNSWSQPIPTDLADPLFLQKHLNITPGIKLLNFQDPNPPNRSLASFIIKGLNAGDEFITKIVDDPSVPGGKDYWVNVMIRQNLLKGKSSLDFDATNVLPPFNYDGSDTSIVQHVKLQLANMSIYGLDSFNSIVPLAKLGPQTIQKRIGLKFLKMNITLKVELDLNLGKYFKVLQPVHVAEEIVISASVSDITTGIALLLAIDNYKLETLKVGTFLRPDHIAKCALQVLYDLKIAGLEGSMSDFGVSITGFASKGLGLLVKLLIDSILAITKPSVLRWISHLFQVKIRSFLNEKVLGKLFPSDCPAFTVVADEFVDFRELLLDPSTSKSVGGAGLEPFGKLVHLVFGLAQRVIQSPKINDVIGVVTQKAFGQAGTVKLSKTLFSISKDLLEKMKMKYKLPGVPPIYLTVGVADLEIDNLNTIDSPLLAGMPTTNATALDTKIAWKSLGLPLGGQIKLSIGTKSDYSTLVDVNDNIVVAISFDLVQALIEVGVKMYTTKFVNLPLRAATSLDCWLTTMPDPSVQKGLSILFSQTVLKLHRLGLTCVQCSSGATALSQVLGILNSIGVISLLFTKIPAVVDDLLTSSWVQAVLDSRIRDAPRFCPISPEYRGPNANRTKILVSAGIPVLSATSIDSLILAGVVAAPVGILVVAENQKSRNAPPTHPLSGQEKFHPPAGRKFIDWTNLGNSTGLGPIADTAFASLNDFLTGRSETGELNIVSSIKGLLDQNGALDLDLSKYGRAFYGFAVNLTTVRVVGLDSISRLEGLQPIAPQTLFTAITLDYLEVTIGFALGYPPNMNRYSMTLSLKNLTAELSLFPAIEADTLFNMNLGSLLRIQNILPCMLTTIFAFNVPHLALNVGSVSRPIFTGLLADTSSAINSVWDAIASRYGHDIAQLIPELILGPVQELGSVLYHSFFTNTCPKPNALGASTLLDYRELLLDPQTSKSLGGAGLEPFGDLLYKIVGPVQEFARKSDQNGLLSVNKVIQPVTKNQSGVTGEIFLPKLDVLVPASEAFTLALLEHPDLIRASALIDQYGIRIMNLRIQHLDTVVDPLALVNATKKASVLSNLLTVGARGLSPLQVNFDLGVARKRRFSLRPNLPLRWEYISLQVSVQSFQVNTQVAISAGANNVLFFPLKRAIKVDCILALIDAIAVEKSNTKINSLDVKIRPCRNCTQDTLAFQTELSSLLLRKPIRDRLATLVVDTVLKSKLVQTKLNDPFIKAKSKCPEWNSTLARRQQ